VSIEITIEERDAKRIWDQYIRRIERIIKPLDPDMREETSLEIHGHRIESLHEGKGQTEIERLLDAMEPAGDPAQADGCGARLNRDLRKGSNSLRTHRSAGESGSSPSRRFAGPKTTY
jgi:hypothetical protein